MHNLKRSRFLRFKESIKYIISLPLNNNVQKNKCNEIIHQSANNKAETDNQMFLTITIIIQI
jgi:hypothetical protein